MRKSFLFLMIACFTATAVQAQFRFGPKVGISTNFIGADMMKYIVKDNSIGFYVGPTAEYRFDGPIGIDGSVLYAQKTVKFTGQDSHQIGYVQIPLNFKYFFAIQDETSVFLAAGPYVGFQVVGDDSFTVSQGNYTGQWDVKKTAVGGIVTLGVEFFEILQVNLSYQMGTSDEVTLNNLAHSAKEKQLSFALALYF